MAANLTEWAFNLFDMRKRKSVSDSTGLALVMTQGAPTSPTMYSDANGTITQSNPITFSNGNIRFFTDSGTTAIDLSVVTADGQSIMLKNVGPSDHRIDIDPDRMDYTLCVPFAVTASGVIAASPLRLTSNMRVYDAFLRITTSDTTATMDVGTTTGSATGFMQALLLTSTGYRIVDEATVAAGALGGLLANPVTATQYNFRRFHVPANATSALSIIYQMTTAAGTTLGGYIFLVYKRLPTP